MAPTQRGLVVGAWLPPAGSSVMARALVASRASGGLATSRTNFPLASGRRVSEGIGLPPDVLGINQSCNARVPDGAGTFKPETTMPNLACQTALSFPV